MARMSNRGRIQRMAEEAAAAREDKPAKPEGVVAKVKVAKVAKVINKKAKTPVMPRPAGKRKAPVFRGRMKIMWAVGVPGGKTLQTFAYPKRAEAEAEAARLTSVKGTLHVVRDERHAMEEGE